MSTSSFDVAIVGAGIIGAACADACSAEGFSVVVVEKDIVAGGTTAAGMGHIVVMDDSEAQFTLTRYSEKLWRELASELPPEVEFDPCGTIWVAADEEEMSEVSRKHDFYGMRGTPSEILDAKALEAAEPHLRKGLRGGLLVPEDCVLYAPCATRFLLDRAVKRGARLWAGQTVSSLGSEGITLSDGTRVSTGIMVIAAGIGSSRLTAGVDVRGRKGHLIVTDRYPGFVRHQLVELGYLKSAHTRTSESVAFNIQPRRTGQMLIGSSRQFGIEDAKVDARMLKWMIDRATEYMPELAGLSALRTWTGFRPATPDNLPLIGPSPHHPGVYLATGHEGLGITTSLGTARLLVDQLVHRQSAIPIEPYLPSRMLTKEAHA